MLEILAVRRASGVDVRSRVAYQAYVGKPRRAASGSSTAAEVNGHRARRTADGEDHLDPLEVLFETRIGRL